MNYIKELNAFRDWLILNRIHPNACLLWHTLIMINNKTGWKKRFYGHNPLVEQLTGLNKLAISKARKILVEHQLIRYEPGHKGKAPIYEMISLVQPFGPMVQPVDLMGKPVDQMNNSVDQSTQWTIYS